MSTIKLKRSAIEGKIPLTSDLELGEIAINTFDGDIYLKRNQSGTESIVKSGMSWIDFVTWPAEDLGAGNITVNNIQYDGNIVKHTKSSKIVYRFIPSEYDPLLDGIYETNTNNTLTNLILNRG